MDWIFDRSSACSIAGVIGGGTESAITRHYGPRAVQIANVSYRFVVSSMAGEYGRPAAVRLHRLRASISLIHREPRVIDAFPTQSGVRFAHPVGRDPSGPDSVAGTPVAWSHHPGRTGLASDMFIPA